MSRPDCLASRASACVAKTPGKHCHRCMMTARNKSPKQREALRVHKKAHPALTPQARANALTREARLKACHTRRERAMAWCPPEYRDLYTKLTRKLGGDSKYSAADARALIEESIEQERRRRITESQRSLKRGGGNKVDRRV